LARILVIDDDPLFRDLAEFALSRAGHEVLQEADGAAGCARLARGGVDVVLVDMHMPGADAASTLARIGAARGAARVVAVSGGGAGGEDPLAAALAAGADLALEKRFTPGELVEAVEGLLGGRPAPGGPGGRKGDRWRRS